MDSASKIAYTFNWFYINRKHIAYYNSGENPVRAASTSTRTPGAGHAASSRGAATTPTSRSLATT